MAQQERKCIQQERSCIQCRPQMVPTPSVALKKVLNVSVRHVEIREVEKDHH